MRTLLFSNKTMSLYTNKFHVLPVVSHHKELAVVLMLKCSCFINKHFMSFIRCRKCLTVIPIIFRLIYKKKVI